MVGVKDYNVVTEIQWCPGCPNHMILRALKQALASLGLKPRDICLVSGIGQAAKLPHYIACNFFNGLHGRALPVATGIAVSNPSLKVIVTTGDGDCYGEGGNHFLHTFRRNPDISIFVHNNSIYALTKGQASPTTPLGERRTLQLRGVLEPPLSPLALALVAGCGFVARGFALDVEHLAELMVQAVSYRGCALVDIIQPCITWDPRPLDWFRERVSYIEGEHDPSDFGKALDLALRNDFAVGVLYKGDPKPVFGEDFFRRSGMERLVGIDPEGAEVISEVLQMFRPGQND
ncbi:thiamine pyrophosphate-dependent enzyme [Thermodesulforhabdus norvegica]|uniref:2-oxoglutarate ferredoxin oxidoreductase subunit beta n=1 Tax=Thermodesulforhabdus norvegica TaxID=39841 RepID=A0A1I4RD31_9BACT|nr:thiamine pyrophosphate-dependent enzyme [Thermodesulforhabdus norvegica]SFM49843.1 2-oxoglutarate ferredoxin oxidoreductase subunit beta [Thermodesulforhabdus norvegica]